MEDSEEKRNKESSKEGGKEKRSTSSQAHVSGDKFQRQWRKAWTQRRAREKNRAKRDRKGRGRGERDRRETGVGSRVDLPQRPSKKRL